MNAVWSPDVNQERVITRSGVTGVLSQFCPPHTAITLAGRVRRDTTVASIERQMFDLVVDYYSKDFNGVGLA